MLSSHFSLITNSTTNTLQENVMGMKGGRGGETIDFLRPDRMFRLIVYRTFGTHRIFPQNTRVRAFFCLLPTLFSTRLGNSVAGPTSKNTVELTKPLQIPGARYFKTEKKGRQSARYWGSEWVVQWDGCPPCKQHSRHATSICIRVGIAFP